MEIGFLMKHFAMIAVLLLVSGCSSNVLSGFRYNSNIERIAISIADISDGKTQVIVKNQGSKPVRYMGLFGFPTFPTYYKVVQTHEGQELIVCNGKDLTHHFSIGNNETLSFTFAKDPTLVKVGFPIFNEDYDEYVIWFYPQE